jgi:hypothetical protein
VAFFDGLFRCTALTSGEVTLGDDTMSATTTPPIGLGSVQVIPRLPNCYHPQDGEQLPPRLLGAKVVRVGTIDRGIAESVTPCLEGGGLVIDYMPENSGHLLRTVLAFNELAMWVVYSGELRE